MESKYSKPISLANAILFSFMCCVFAYAAYQSTFIERDLILSALQICICLLSLGQVTTSIAEYCKGGESATKYLVDAVATAITLVVYVALIVVSIVHVCSAEPFDVNSRLSVLWLVMLLALGGILVYRVIRVWKQYKEIKTYESKSGKSRNRFK